MPDTPKDAPLTFQDILAKFTDESFTQKQKGSDFEHLMQHWLKTENVYASLFCNVWLWEEFPCKKDFGGKDIGIDLVAKTHEGEYWAIQCKCYSEDTTINKAAIDSFIAASSRQFYPEDGTERVGFSRRLWISTTNKGWTAEAEHEITNQNPPFSRISLSDIEKSTVDWQKLLENIEGKGARKKPKRLLRHQRRTLEKAFEHYISKGKTRGKLIMACGTGKTFTSLRIAEMLTEVHTDKADGSCKSKGLILFMVPSIALLGQALNDWFSDSTEPMKAVCVCSDPRSSRKTSRGRRVDDTDESMSLVDLALPATTNKDKIAERLLAYREHEGLVVVFSTYQSVQAVMDAQKLLLNETEGEYGEFDLIVCDEAHRTTGAKLKDEDESEFTKIHYDVNVKAKRRLYMTATPRIYGDNAKSKAKEKDCILCSMDDEDIYGEEFQRVTFSYAVREGILTDYRVIVLTQTEGSIPATIEQDVADPEQKGIDYNTAGRLIGVINGLSKRLTDAVDKKIIETDPQPMKRALAFTRVIGNTNTPGSSKSIAHFLPQVCEKYIESLNDDEKKGIVRVAARHVDGSMGATQRNEALSWLAAKPTDPSECRVICNVRCLSEGVDVPALDAVLFLSPKNSQVDVVQSVGRVMRAFKKGTAEEKKYGYIIIPVVVPEGMSASDALDDNKTFAAVWQILNALRAHDDHFNAIVNTIALNEGDSKGNTGGKGGKGGNGEGEGTDGNDLQGKIMFDGVTGYKPKLVEKCGERMYWENWASDIGTKAASFIDRITRLVKDTTGQFAEPFCKFVESLRRILNPKVSEDECIEMLAQHVITRPVFEALFEGYEFLKLNAVSVSMQKMIDVLLTSNVFTKDMEEFGVFFELVRANVKGIDTLQGKQTVIKYLYERFFKIAFPKTTEKLGIVYTPVECVDFILQSVDDILRNDFGVTMASESVHILDPFTGTGTFIARLLQSGLIESGDDLRRKYQSEIHANEINLLAYYVASVNIEAVFHETNAQTEYIPFEGLCLTDTFQTTEEADTGYLFDEFFAEENEILKKQKSTQIQVIIGNPPYSVGQRSANDNAQNTHYQKLEKHIDETYAALSTANLKKALYDSYVKAFRWATDRLDKEHGGVIAFITNAGWLDGNAQDGMRATLECEFDKIYVYNLRGNARTSGELRRREGDNVFGQGTRTPVAITFLVKLPQSHSTKAQIFYRDIGDYLSREQKVYRITRARSVSGIGWQLITPNEKHDWINPRTGEFDSLILIGDKDDKANKQTFFEPVYSNGVVTSRDAWAYNSSKKALIKNIKSSIEFYNSEVDRCTSEAKANLDKKPADFINFDSTKFKWDRAQKETDLPNGKKYEFDKESVRTTIYRPFFKQFGYFNRDLNNCVYQMPQLFPTADSANLVICVSGIGVTKDFSCIITDTLPDLELIGKSQCFPLYWYTQKQVEDPNLFEAGKKQYVSHCAITDWIMSQIRQRFIGAQNLTKETVFYYVYGVLHSPDYRKRFAADLKKSLPRLPIAQRAADFNAFSEAGRKLASLHLGYDKDLTHAQQRAAGFGAAVSFSKNPPEDTQKLYEFYRVEKMRFAKGVERKTTDKSRIIFNHVITVTVPPEVYGYVVNGKSAVEWIMERYAVTVDKKSGITNDPNDWAREVENPRYVLDVLLSVICVSIETCRVTSALPEIKVAKES